jgi:hypothetical protein
MSWVHAQSFYSDDSTLIAHYPFKWDATDKSEHANGGEVEGATLAADRFGIANRAYEFDGSFDYIEMGSSEIHRIDGDLTISLWFNARSFEGSRLGVVTFQDEKSVGDSTSNTLYSLHFSGNHFLSYNHQSGVGLNEEHEFENVSFNTNSWNHVVLTRDISEKKIWLYVNGEVADSTEFELQPEGGESSTLRVGEDRSTNAPDRFFRGKIDDIRIFNAVKTDSTIQEMYTEYGWPQSENYDEYQMLLHLPLNENAKDISSFDHHGNVEGATLTTDRFGNENSAYHFDGVDDKIVIKDSTLHTFMDSLSSEITISAWVYLEEQVNANPLIVERVDNSTETRKYSLGINTSENRAQTKVNRYTYNSAEPVIQGKWYLITGILKETGSNSLNLRTYVNEKGLGSTIIFGDENIIDIENGDIIIGGNTSNSGAFSGKLDDIRIYNYELAQFEIQWLYEEAGWQGEIESTLQAYYELNGNAEDISGNGRDGSVFGAEVVEDRFGNTNRAFLFNGEDDYITIPTAFDYRRRTVSTWVKINNTDSNSPKQTILEQDSDDLSAGTMGLYFEEGNFWYREGSVANRISQSVDSDTWYHLAMTREDSLVKGYLNGDLVGTAISDGVSTWRNDTSALHIATDRSFTNFLNGALDEIRIYNSMLEESEIEELYSQGGWPIGKNSDGTALEMLAAYYPFNENALDSTESKRHGAVQGAELTTDQFGTPNSAYLFNDINDHISIDSLQFIGTNKDFTFSFLAKGTSNTQDFATIVSRPELQPYGIAIDDGDRILFTVRSETDSLNLIIDGLNTDRDKWYHYAAVYKSDEYLKLHRDGEQIGIINNVLQEVIDEPQTPIIIGGSSVSNYTSYFSGSIDEIRFFSGYLSTLQVSKIYQKDGLGTPIEPSATVPKGYQLYQNYPNPFNPSTVIRFDLPHSSKVSLTIYSITGKVVATLVNGIKSAGTHQVIFNAEELASGIYLYELKGDNYRKVQKLTLIK